MLYINASNAKLGGVRKPSEMNSEPTIRAKQSNKCYSAAPPKFSSGQIEQVSFMFLFCSIYPKMSS